MSGSKVSAGHPNITVSVVSHAHSAMVLKLIDQIQTLSALFVQQIVVTNNLPSVDDFEPGLDFNLATSNILVVKNPKPIGFGINHNQAFQHCKTEYFCVLNPDIIFLNDPFEALLKVLQEVQVGCAYPLQNLQSGRPVESERPLATPWSILQRQIPYLGKLIPGRQLPKLKSTEFKQTHWVNGAFMLFRSDVFRQLGGFDERYFMYCEDVDICLRLQLAGYQLARADTTVIHDTGRRTLRDFQHFAWHVRSLFRLWGSKAYRDFKQRFIEKTDEKSKTASI
jgi:N-acetylglucosaminyl-diphospho-decaprenol L-rhamnosyltransferase